MRLARPGGRGRGFEEIQSLTSLIMGLENLLEQNHGNLTVKTQDV